MKGLFIKEQVTNRSTQIDRYFKDVGSRKKLLPEEEVALANRIQAGDESAVEELVRHNLRFVISVAKQYAVTPDLLGELISQGNIGLVEAARTFDPTRGFKFISYAVWIIRKEMLKYFSEESRTIRLPQNLQTDLSRARRAESRLMNELGREATVEEIVEQMQEMGWEADPKKLEATMRLAEGTVPWEVSDPEIVTPSAWISSEDSADSLIHQDETVRVAKGLLQLLEPRDRTIVTLYLGIGQVSPKSFAEIGERYDKTQEWARQRYTRSIRKIKNWSRINRVGCPI